MALELEHLPGGTTESGAALPVFRIRDREVTPRDFVNVYAMENGKFCVVWDSTGYGMSKRPARVHDMLEAIVVATGWFKEMSKVRVKYRSKVTP